MIVVLDYGMGNLRSVQNAVENLGYECTVSSSVSGATKLVLPGVGAFAKAMEKLAPIEDEIKAFVAAGGPLLGLCLGQQLLFEESEEHGVSRGLGLLKGKVKYLSPSVGNKVPNIGWAPVSPQPGSKLFEGIGVDQQFYFVHSLYTECADLDDVAATADHTSPFVAAVEHNNIWATQFHPEKSGEPGLRLIRNFLQC